MASYPPPFSSSYRAARTKFLDVAREAHAKIISLELEGVRGPDGEVLTIDIAILGDHGTKDPANVFLHSSGVHGAEGFAGSAIQIDFLRRVSRDQALVKSLAAAKGTKIVLVHAVNPYGMAWIRRFNEKNVDLNRNFLLDSRNFEEMLSDSKRNVLYSVIHPSLVPRKDTWCFDCRFFTNVLTKIFQYGYSRTKRAVASGQYEYKTGLYYGGLELQQGPKLLVDTLTSIGVSPTNTNLQLVLHVDVHTGLGIFGEDLFIPSTNKLMDTEGLISVFGSDRVALGTVDSKAGVLYETEGSFDTIALQLLRNSSTKPKIITVCQEFGTYNPISVLRAVILENSWWQEDKETPIDKPVKVGLLRAFYPDSKDWETRVLARGAIAINQCLSKISVRV